MTPAAALSNNWNDKARIFMNRNKMERAFIAAGLVPAVWFIVIVSVIGALTPGYNSISQQASELTLMGTTPRIVVDIAAQGTGLFIVLFGIGVWLLSRKTVAFGAIAWILFGISMITNGIWRMGSPMHGAYGLGLIVMVAPALSLTELKQFQNDDKAYLLTGLISFVGVIYFWMNVLGHDPHIYRGLTQRTYAMITMLWPAWVSFRLIRRSDLALDSR